MIDWIKTLQVINYKFDSIGTSSIDSYDHQEFGKLIFTWSANKSKIQISFVNTSTNCICKEPTIVSCDCSWIAFQESDVYPSKIFTKAEVEKLKQPTLFNL